METVIRVVAIIIILIILFIYVLPFLFSLAKTKIKNHYQNSADENRNRIVESLRNEYEKYFLGKFSYYDRLPQNLKIRFLSRVRKFISCKTFEGRDGIVVTGEMKALTAAAAIQLTFGLNEFLLDYFSKIIIYPDSYYSPITGEKHMGEANLKGILVLSWKDLLRGYEIPDDAYNVGLHEMAHALELEKVLGGEYDFYFTSYYEKWKRVSEDEYFNLKDEGDSYFRSYAGTNRHEFFAVCIEHFFEESEEFRSKLPEIYNHLCILLNQDPLSKDMLVKTLKHKNTDEIYKEAVSSEVLFTTRYSISDKLIFPISIFAIYFLVFANNYKPEFKPLLAICSLLITIVYGVSFILSINKIILFDKYLAVMNVFKKIKIIYPLEEIVTVTFQTGMKGSLMEILFLHDGKIYKNDHSYLSKPNDNASLTRLLEEKNVIVKKS